VSLATPSIENADFRRPFLSQMAGRKAAAAERDYVHGRACPLGEGLSNRKGILDTEHSGRRDYGRLVIEFTYKDLNSLIRKDEDLHLKATIGTLIWAAFTSSYPVLHEVFVYHTQVGRSVVLRDIPNAYVDVDINCRKAHENIATVVFVHIQQASCTRMLGHIKNAPDEASRASLRALNQCSTSYA
jgi:hypothetical protein